MGWIRLSAAMVAVCICLGSLSIAAAQKRGRLDYRPRQAIDLEDPAVTHLELLYLTPTSATLRWMAPGDDDRRGMASVYDLRYLAGVDAQFEIKTPSGGKLTPWFEQANQVAGLPAPTFPGMTEFFTITGLHPTTEYVFALKAADEVEHWSPLSNQLHFTTPTDLNFVLVSPDGKRGYASIQAAVNAAQPGEIVLLANGVYRGEGNRDIDFRGKRLSLFSISGNPVDCVIDCERSGRALLVDFPGGAVIKVHGISFENALSEHGAGVLGFRSTLTFTVCDFVNNYAQDGSGGAIHLEGCQASFKSCNFYNNAAKQRGGVIYATDSITDFSRCALAGNEARDGAAAAFTSEEAFPERSRHMLSACLFAWNKARNAGGAILGSDAHINISQSTISHNTAGKNGAAITCQRTTTLSMHSSIFAFCSGGELIDCDGADVLIKEMRCCDVFGIKDGNYRECIKVESGRLGNFEADPLFVNPDKDDFRLTKDSPCGFDFYEECAIIGAFAQLPK